MLWIRCCRLMRRRKVHEQAQNYKEKAIILANPSGGLGSVPPPVWLRQTVQGAFYPGPLIGSRLRRGQFAFPASDCPRDKHHLSRGRSQPDGLALKSGSFGHWPQNQFDRSDLPRHSSDHDCPQPLFLRKYLLHAMGEQQGRHRYSHSAF